MRGYLQQNGTPQQPFSGLQFSIKMVVKFGEIWSGFATCRKKTFADKLTEIFSRKHSGGSA
jgi:hypothetical protein